MRLEQSRASRAGRPGNPAPQMPHSKRGDSFAANRVVYWTPGQYLWSKTRLTHDVASQEPRYLQPSQGMSVMSQAIVIRLSGVAGGGATEIETIVSKVN